MTTAARSTVLPDVVTVGDVVPGYEASFWTGVGAPRTLPPRSLVSSIGRATVDSRRRSFRWTRSPHPASGRIRRTRPASCRAGVTVPRLPLDGHPWASPQGSGLQAEICCAEGQQQPAECGNPGGVNKVRHTNKNGAKTQNWPPQNYGQSGPSRRLSAARDLAAGSRASLS